MKKRLPIAAIFLVILNYASAQWSLTGNAGTTPATNFLGTTDNRALAVRTKNIERLRIMPDGKIGVGTKTPLAYFHVFGTMQIENNSGTIYDEPLLTLRNSAANGTPTNPGIAFKGEDTLFATVGYDFSTRDFVISAQPGLYAPNLIINHDNGFVGLNTKTPSNLLHLNDGSLRIDQPQTAQSYIIMNSQGLGNTQIHFRQNDVTQAIIHYDQSGQAFGINVSSPGVTNFAIKKSNGFVGIGNNLSPLYRLDVSGTSRFMGNIGVQTAPGSRTIQCGSTQGALIGIGTAEYIQDAGTSTLSFNESLVPVTNDLWSLGNSSNQWKDVWAIDGTINKSDARDKSNIRDLNYGLKEIMQLHAVKFNWKNDPAAGDKLGVIAQEIQKVLPEVVRDWEYRVDETSGKKTKMSTETLGVMYADIIPVLIHGMQEQQKEIEALKQQVQQLTGNLSNNTQSAASEKQVAGNFMLMQNAPNPFNKTTAINYTVNANFKTAQIIINDNAGRTLKKIPLDQTKTGMVTFDGSSFNAGTYYYSLMVDGKLLDTKTMIISK